MIVIILSSFRKSSLDIKIINKYLSFWPELIDTLFISNVDFTELLSSISNNLKYEFCAKDSVLFRYGEKAKNFNILISGKVGVMLPRELVISLTENEYIEYLTKLKKYEEYALINDVLLKQNNYPIKDIDWLRNLTSPHKKNYLIKFSHPSSEIKSEFNLLNEFKDIIFCILVIYKLRLV